MPYIEGSRVRTYYEERGSGEPVVLIGGLSSTIETWGRVADLLAERYRVIRPDNRGSGRTKLEPDDGDRSMQAFAGDVCDLLDALELDTVHLVGASMGGMIVQQMVIDHPDRVRSVTSIMSTTGDLDVGQPAPAAAAMLLRPPPTTRDEAIASGLEVGRAIGSPAHFDEERSRQRAEVSYDRCFYPEGVAHQLLGILASPSRTEALGAVTVPALVIHGDSDPLVTPSGGRRTAEAIPGAELLELEGMGHDLPPVFWPTIIESITKLAARSAAPA